MNFLRQIVSGPKKRFVEDGYNLDLTYVCPRLIAMSFPASGLETLYRNNIDNVSKMIKNKHGGDYLIINLSGRKYDYSKFQDKVLDYEWEDHHSPPINTLFIICEKIHQFLKKKKENVAIIHCLAGKGRTGTIICCYMLYTGRFEIPEEALLYYGKKRFLQEGLGVNQPCQIRYVFYFHLILKQRNMYPTLKYIKQIEMVGRPKFSDDGCRPFVDLINVHSKEKIYTTQKSHSEQQRFVETDTFVIIFEQSQPISGDILVRFKNNGAISNKDMVRVSFNTAFIKTDNILEFGLSELSPSQVLKDERFPKGFMIRIVFGDFCQCNCFTPFEKKCSSCMLELDKETEAWQSIYKIIANYKIPTPQEQTELLFGKEPEDIDEILNKEKKIFVETMGVLSPSRSSGESSDRLSNFNEYMFKKLHENEGDQEECCPVKEPGQKSNSNSDEEYNIIKGNNYKSDKNEHQSHKHKDAHKKGEITKDDNTQEIEERKQNSDTPQKNQPNNDNVKHRYQEDNMHSINYQANSYQSSQMDQTGANKMEEFSSPERQRNQNESNNHKKDQ